MFDTLEGYSPGNLSEILVEESIATIESSRGVLCVAQVCFVDKGEGECISLITTMVTLEELRQTDEWIECAWRVSVFGFE